MSRTKEEFVKRWQYHVLGMVMFGVSSEKNDGPTVRASKVFELPAEVQKLLGQLYDDLQSPKPETNGHVRQVKNEKASP